MTARENVPRLRHPQRVFRHRIRARPHGGPILRGNSPRQRPTRLGRSLAMPRPTALRLLSRRSIVTSREDWPYYYYAAPGLMEEWMEDSK